MKVFFKLFFLMILLVSGFYEVKADELLLKNGDRITGDIIILEDGRLVFTTAYAGKISVNWNEVSGFFTDGLIKVVLKNNSTIVGKMEKTGNGRMKIKQKNISEPVSFDIADIKYINPKVIPLFVKVKGRANLGMSRTKGNTDTSTRHFDGEFLARTIKNRYTFGAELNQADDSGEQSTDNALGYMKYDRFIAKKTFFYVNSRFEKDDFQDLNLRTAIGTGMGYQFLESDISNLSLDFGPTYVNEDMINSEDETFISGHWALNYDRFFLDNLVIFFHFNEGFLNFEETNDTLIRSRTGFRFPFRKNFNSTLQCNFDWDNEPSSGQKKVDKTFLVTVGCQY